MKGITKMFTKSNSKQTQSTNKNINEGANEGANEDASEDITKDIYKAIIKDCELRNGYSYTNKTPHVISHKLEKNRRNMLIFPIKQHNVHFIDNIMININKQYFDYIGLEISGTRIYRFYPRDIDILHGIFGIINNDKLFQLPIASVFKGQLVPYVSKYHEWRIIFSGSDAIPEEGINFNLTYDTIETLKHLAPLCDNVYPIIQTQFTEDDIIEYGMAKKNKKGDIPHWNILYENNSTYIRLLCDFNVIALNIAFDQGTLLNNVDSITLNMGYDKNNNAITRTWNKLVLNTLFKVYNTGLITFFPARSDISAMFNNSINFSILKNPYLTIKFTKEYNYKQNKIYVTAVNFNGMVTTNGGNVSKNTDSEYNEKVVECIELYQNY